MTLPPGLDRFDHLVVLMMENRSFDNLLGYTYENDHPQRFIGRGTLEFRGVAGRNDLFNLDANNQKVFVGKAPGDTPMQMCEPCPDPGEFYQPHVNRQVYGSDVLPGSFSQLPDPAPMSGFVQDYIRSIKEQEFWDGVEPTPNQYRAIMNCFAPDALPVTTGLARAFAVSDEWFASVPSQTFCNRSFLHSAQSNGWVTNSDYSKWRLNDHPTIFDRLTDKLGAGRDWRIYIDRQEAFSLTWALHPTLRHAQYRDRFRHFDLFEQDCRNGDLPAYTFIEPRLIVNHNDMHPPVVPNQEVESSVLAGELLINSVYDAVRNGKNWLRTLLVIVFDEHGGTYDHWPPPRATPPVEDPVYPLQFGFQFDRFGVRVPAIFISPYIAAGTVVRATGDTPFDHTTLIKTLCSRFDLEGLTNRDRAAPDIGSVFTLSDAEARRETPAMQPRPYKPLTAAQAGVGLLTGFQRDFHRLASHLLTDVEGLAHKVNHKLKPRGPDEEPVQYTEVRDHIRDADIFLFRGSYLISKIFERVDHSFYSHAAMVGWWHDRLMILQAEGVGVQSIPLSVAIASYPGRVDWYRLKREAIPDAEAKIIAIMEHARSELGLMYGFGPLLRDIWHALYRRFRLKDPKTPGAMFCSEFVEYCFKSAGLPLSQLHFIETMPKHIAASPHLEYMATIQHDPKDQGSRNQDSVPVDAVAK